MQSSHMSPLGRVLGFGLVLLVVVALTYDPPHDLEEYPDSPEAEWVARWEAREADRVETEKRTAAEQAMLREAECPESRLLYTLSAGESRWTSPWSLWVDSKGRRWLDPTANTYASQNGNATMKVVRRSNGFAVAVDSVGSELESSGWWKPTDQPPPLQKGSHWLRVASFGWIPHTDPPNIR